MSILLHFQVVMQQQAAVAALSEECLIELVDWCYRRITWLIKSCGANEQGV